MIRVLIADDHELVRTGIGAALDAEDGIEVVALCHDGQHAVDRTEELLPDVVVTDLFMPRLDGVEVTRQIRERWPNTRVLILTGRPASARAGQALDAGAEQILAKGADPRELITAVLEGPL